jgi:type I restriction enzyme S subunit
MSEGIINRLGGTIEPASFCRKFRPINEKIGLLASVHLQKIYNDGKTWEYQNQSTGISNFQTKTFLAKEVVLIPSESILNIFYGIAIDFINRKDLEQSLSLTKLRDTLLPKLISGELQIPDVNTADEKTA